MRLLDQINKENDIKSIRPADFPQLAAEIRDFLLDKVCITGGHVASNLGAVELTMALHLCMELPEDKIIFDVGHQSYTHKLLTGRREGFDTLRQLDGMSGFPKSCESECDAFNTGHSSTSISAALGIVMASKLKAAEDPEYVMPRVAAVIGDGSMTGGLAYEALDAVSQLKAPLVIVLNDNEMSIGKNVGGFSKAMNRIRAGRSYNELKSDVENALMTIPSVGPKVAKSIKRSKDSIKNLLVPGMLFEEMGITYIGPVDGHNVQEMVDTFERAFRLKKPIIVHVKTRKGKGYIPAERHPERFHGIGPFDRLTGVPTASRYKTFTDVFAKTLLELGRENPKMVAITAAMARGTGVRAFQREWPERTFDVGIAEAHAVTFAAGLAKEGMLPVVAVYSSFLQRAYDQILHDVCLQKLHVIFAMDRSGLVGEDGETHHGIYDTAYLDEMPGLTVMSPRNGAELAAMLRYAVHLDGPVAIKYPKGSAQDVPGQKASPVELGKAEIVYSSSDFRSSEDVSTEESGAVNTDPGAEKSSKRVTIISVGPMASQAETAGKILEREDGLQIRVINARFIKPLDSEMLRQAASESDLLVILEESVQHGSYGEAAAYLLQTEGCRVPYLHFCIEPETVPHGTVASLRKRLGLDTDSIAERIRRRISELRISE